MDKASYALFVKMQQTGHCLNDILPNRDEFNVNLRPRGHCFQLSVCFYNLLKTRFQIDAFSSTNNGLILLFTASISLVLHLRLLFANKDLHTYLNYWFKLTFIFFYLDPKNFGLDIRF
jgi:hypothetical protein